MILWFGSDRSDLIESRGEEPMADGGKGGFTRRDLMRGTLVGAIASGVKTKLPADEGPLGPDAAPLELDVNGVRHRLELEPRVTLVDALRERIGLTGTKIVCGRGACGACTVLVDGETVCSCLVLAHEAAGRRITTIEGLAAQGRLSPLQEAFVATDALQCGFCTSGMVLSCHSLLAQNPKPSRQEIRTAISGNLCRCGTYNHVFEAVERAAGLKTVVVGREAETSDAAYRPPPAPFRLEDDARVALATAEAMEEEA
jgi:xanthine dehydrogenase YagT iron-sulfur-binding subunit